MVNFLQNTNMGELAKITPEFFKGEPTLKSSALSIKLSCLDKR